jgi:ornithine cyclodeaminase/alanine dehydrogenase-like protein (mu-crystallin family)
VSGQQALRVVSGALVESGCMGIRLGPNSQLSGGDSMYALLFENESGRLLSFMGYPFGTLRTAATVGLAARHMARKDARTVGLFGVGRNALGLIKGIAAVRKISRVVVSSRDAERRKSFCAGAAKELKLDVVPGEKPEEAVRQMDIILTATNSASPVFPMEWVEPGAHISSMGKPGEIGKDIYLKADRIVVGSRPHEQNYWDQAGPLPLVELIAAGKFSWDKIPEMGDLVTGRAAGRKGEREIALFKESQGGFGDVAFAKWIYDEAARRGLGREMEL